MIHETIGELDQAISDYSQELALNPMGRMRLADAYCARGSANQKEQKHDAAIADFEKSIDTGSTADGCSCIPTIRCWDSTPRTGDTARAGKSSTRRGGPENRSRPNCWID
ncbi:MAG: tetratricopeptide repeat protein [Bryobacterales bacterium]|nr:tetratricopeptide repeat protein [Bryobacterales bacterium]